MIVELIERQAIQFQRQLQVCEVGQIAEFRRNGTRQVVVRKRQGVQVGKAAEFRRDGTSEVVGGQVQKPQPGEVAELRRDGPRKIVGGEEQLCDLPDRIRRDSVPLSDRLV